MIGDKYIANFVARMKAIDPNYGLHEHQRSFVARLCAAQQRTPCLANHDHDVPPEHRTIGRRTDGAAANAPCFVLTPSCEPTPPTDIPVPHG